MAKETISVGSAPNDGTGNTLRDAMIKVNNNFTDLYGGWSKREDLTNTQTLTAATDNLISYTGTLASNGGISLLNVNSKVTPTVLNDVLHLDFGFIAETPSGGGHFIVVKFIVNSTIVKAMTVPFLRGAGVDDHIYFSFTLNVDSNFLANGGTFMLNPDVTCLIKNRSLIVTRLHKAL